MKKQNRFTQRITILFLTALTLQACGGSTLAPSTEEDIFMAVSADESMEIPMDASESPSRRRRVVKVNFEAIKKALLTQHQTLRLNLFENKAVVIDINQVEQISESNFVVTGTIQGDADSSVTLVLNGEVLVANIKSALSEESFEVHFGGARDLHVVSEPLNLGDSKDACTVVKAPLDADDEPLVEKSEGREFVMAIPTINMLVAYTPNARTKVGGAAAIKALIQLGVADTNEALRGSGANLEVRLVGTLETKQNETTNFSNDLGSLKGTNDSRWNEVHTARAKLGADQVTLIGAYSNVSNPVGIGYFGATKASAFTIVKSSVISTMYTLAHELGHNIGLAHSDGYVNTKGSFRTIMAYGSPKRIRRFSNPSNAYNGYMTGTASKFSANIINYNSARVSNFVR